MQEIREVRYFDLVVLKRDTAFPCGVFLRKIFLVQIPMYKNHQ